MLYVKAPANLCLIILDIWMLARLAHSYLQRLLDHVVDIVVHIATKYLNCHGDVIAGFIIGDSGTMNRMNKSIVGDLGQVQNAWIPF